MDKYLSIITNFGCHGRCPYCIARENGIKVPKSTIGGLDKLEDAIKMTGANIVSISGGGDPLYPGNRMEITALAKEIREKFPEKTIWMYTGSLWETVKSYEVMKYVDVLVDGEYECDKRDTQLHWKGSSNQRVIDVQDSLRRGQVVLHNS